MLANSREIVGTTMNLDQKGGKATEFFYVPLGGRFDSKTIFSLMNLGFGTLKRRRKFKISFSGKKSSLQKRERKRKEREEIESRLFHRRVRIPSTDTTTAFFPLRAQFFY